MNSSGVNPAPAPLLAQGQPVDWWFVFKFNAHAFPGCGEGAERTGLFGGEPQTYRSHFSQQYVYASSTHPALQKGTGCVGATLTDPLGATFNQVYNGTDYYVLWNDQFYNDPCENRDGPWGHSKGLVTWNEDGDGFVLQVSTPSWPASGNKQHPRKTDGNTLGCVKDDDVEVSQHFFALKINGDDLIAILQALQNASVVTDPSNKQVVHNGGPEAVRALVKNIGRHVSKSTTCIHTKLSSGVELISKPSHLHVPPWQMVSAVLDGLPLRVASWWASPEMASTTACTEIGCWDAALGKPGPVEIATSGSWDGTAFSLTGGEGTDHNHAKVGVSTDAGKPLSIFGDMNQQGALSEGAAYKGQKCSSSQNGRGGTFYVVNDAGLFKSVTDLIQGDTAPTSVPKT